jgi:guanylate kinase
VSAAPPRLDVRTFPVIFAAPSGAGKTTIARRLLARRADVEFSISATTRAPRPRERDGVDYHFRSEAQFRHMVEGGELLEWAEVHGSLYGTPVRNLEEARRRRHFLLLDIDVQGSRQIKKAVPEAVSIFVLPPSGRELARRLIGRGSEDRAVQRKRLRAAREEIGAASEFDYVIVNDDLGPAVTSVEQILEAESLRTSRSTGLERLVSELLRDVDRVLETV